MGRKTCKICGYIARGKTTLKLHVKSEHGLNYFTEYNKDATRKNNV